MARCNRELSLGKRLFPEESVFNDLFFVEKNSFIKYALKLFLVGCAVQMQINKKDTF
jgi:hypothetical protein